MAGVGDIISGIGDLFASGSYGQAASLEGNIAEMEKESGALQQYALNRQIYTGLGSEATGAAGGNLKTSGSALASLRNTVQIGNLRKAQTSLNTQIAVTGAELQQQLYGAQQTNAIFGGVGDIVGGLTSMMPSGGQVPPEGG